MKSWEYTHTMIHTLTHQKTLKDYKICLSYKRPMRKYHSWASWLRIRKLLWQTCKHSLVEVGSMLHLQLDDFMFLNNFFKRQNYPCIFSPLNFRRIHTAIIQPIIQTCRLQITSLERIWTIAKENWKHEYKVTCWKKVCSSHSLRYPTSQKQAFSILRWRIWTH